MQANSYDALRAQLETKKAELTIRLDRITENLRRGYHPDSKERAKELEQPIWVIGEVRAGSGIKVQS